MSFTTFRKLPEKTYCPESNEKKAFTTQNAVISPNFLVWKFCGKAQFPHSFGRVTRKYAETVPFHKISAPEN